MKYYIIRNKVARLFGMCLMLCVMCVSCTIDEPDIMDECYQDPGYTYDSPIGNLGVYEGNWTLDGQDAGTGLMEISKDCIIFDTLPQETIVRCVSDLQDITYEPVKYSVKYVLNGSYSDTYYFTLESTNYEFSIKKGDSELPVTVKMSTLHSDLQNAIYNKGILVTMLKISRIEIQTEDGKTVANDYEPALVLMFNPVKRIR